MLLVIAVRRHCRLQEVDWVASRHWTLPCSGQWVRSGGIKVGQEQQALDQAPGFPDGTWFAAFGPKRLDGKKGSPDDLEKSVAALGKKGQLKYKKQVTHQGIRGWEF